MDDSGQESELRRAGANQYDLGSFNEAVIIETIRLAGIISRTEISRRTGVPLGTIKSRTTAALKRLHRSLVSPAAEESRHD